MQFKSSKFGPKNPNVISLKGGESVTGILRGEPHEFEKAFNPEDKPAFRFQINMATTVSGVLTMMILEGGYKLYKQLSELQAGGWNLEKSFVRVSRTGTNKNDTVYTATALPQLPDANTLARVEQLKLHQLGEKNEQQSQSFSQEQDCPF